MGPIAINHKSRPSQRTIRISIQQLRAEAGQMLVEQVAVKGALVSQVSRLHETHDRLRKQMSNFRKNLPHLPLCNHLLFELGISEIERELAVTLS